MQKLVAVSWIGYDTPTNLGPNETGGVAALHDTNGRWDLLAELRATSMAELSQILERVRLIKGIASTETSIHLETFRVS